MNRHFSSSTGWFIIILILLQLVPLNRAIQTPDIPKNIPSGVLPVLKRHCMACHSGATTWPVSAWIAPLSWYVTGKVRQARTALDLSDFDAMPATEKNRLVKQVSQIAGTPRLADHGQIPGFTSSRLNESERRLLVGWPKNNNRE